MTKTEKGQEVDTGESVLFIRIQFSILYTAVDTPSEAA
jgi:hypothetical protein